MTVSKKNPECPPSAYNGARAATSIQNQDGAGNSIGDYTYTYDLAGQLLSEVDNGTTTNYAYDATGQLTGAGSDTYSYDVNGNPANSGDVIGPDNELLSDGTWNYTYDADGNEIEKANPVTGVTWHYGYDAAGEMISAVEDSASGAPLVEVSYTYDVFGNRLEQDVWQASPGTSSPGTTTTTRYAYDGWNPAKAGAIGTSNFDIWATLDGSGSLTSRYVDGDAVDQIFARVDQNGAAWLYTDNLGSVRAVTNGNGSVIDEIDYDAFGNVTNNTNPSATGIYQWTGREFDGETGLQYNRARYYDNTTGRWISQDPLGFDAGDSNLYRYVNNAPTDGNDPSGKEGILVIYDPTVAAMEAYAKNKDLSSPDVHNKMPPPEIVKNGKVVVNPAWTDAALAAIEKTVKNAQQVAGKTRPDEIRFYTHGQEGSFAIGGVQIRDVKFAIDHGGTEQQKHKLENALKALGNIVRPGGKIKSYGCQSGKGPDAQKMVNSLTAKTGRQVSATPKYVNYPTVPVFGMPLFEEPRALIDLADFTDEAQQTIKKSIEKASSVFKGTLSPY